MNYNDIKRFTEDGHYRVDVLFQSISDHIEKLISENGLILIPDFQRGHVWTEDQQIKFVEYILRGGITSDIRFNHPGWMRGWEGEFVCVDGLQRITAIMEFQMNTFPVLGSYYKDYEGRTLTSLGFRVNNLKTKKEVLQWYVELNDGGTPHSDKEINKVKKMIEKEK